MTKATLTKFLGTVAAATAAGGASFLPEQYRPLALAVAGLALGWLHLPRPGDAKVRP
jgi:hypothetical protein